ncbi:MAG: hypothetical protein IJC61_05055 [Oscillospiraceae bacterium]|nr:hypothetical protein [Oscillospiraceae bacterium]
MKIVQLLFKAVMSVLLIIPIAINSLFALVVPQRETYREWTAFISELDFTGEVTVLDSACGRTVGVNGGSNDNITFSYGMIVQTQLSEDELCALAERCVQPLNEGRDAHSESSRMTHAWVHYINMSYLSEGLFDAMLEEARQQYGSREDVYFLVFTRIGRSLLIN